MLLSPKLVNQQMPSHLMAELSNLRRAGSPHLDLAESVQALFQL